MFGHLQIKSAYSFQASTILIKDLIADAVSKQIQALALCDVNNMYGMFEFYQTCIRQGVKPIIGVEASIKVEDEIYPFLLLATDDLGYFELVSLVSDINLSDERCVDLKDIIPAKDHLFIISASPEGIVERLLMKEMDFEAERIMRLLKDMFLDRYLVMVNHSGIAMEDHMHERLNALASYLKIKVICGNDVCYLRQQDALAVDLMQASAASRTLDPLYEPRTKQKYLKTQAQMEALFDPAIIRNTVEVIDFCNAHIPTKVKYLPDFPLPQGIQKSDYLKQLCIVGIKKRFQGSRVPSSYQQRLLHELTLIHQMGFDDYFLIVWDYVRYAKVHGIFVGPGRGSAAGSLVAYALGITNVDPIKYDLIFERFLNPERVSLPDIDIDFQDDRRDEVVDYVIQKYGHEHAAQIVTFTTYGPRNAIKDIGKVMSLPLPRLEMIAKMVPTNPKSKKTITQMYQTSASFQSLVNEQAVMRRLIGPMSVIEHLPRNISKHAAGVVLSGQPLKRIVPLVVGPSSSVMTQYSKNYIEEAGFLKMDFLGLKNLTMIAYICHDLEEKEHIRLNINTLDLNDQPTYHLLSQGDTYGVFQLESAGMRQLLRRMKPSCFDDIVAAIALYRPGPMENIPLYLKGRAEGAFEPLLPELKDILKPTYGIIIYQEQIMQIAQIVGGFSFSKADILRQGISKKKGELISQLREEFLSGARAKGIDEGKAEEIFDMIEKFGDYGFNKSHSVAYGLVAYQLAYLKTHYPLYFFASILSNEGSSTATKIHVIEESRKHGVKILPPSINYSYDRFIVEGHSIRYALLAVKNVGLAIYQTIAKEREKGLFKDMYDFLSRIASRLSAKTIESLIDAGAFDEFNPNRAFLKGNLATMSEYAYLSDSLGLDEPPVLRNVRENQYQRLENEKEALGLYLTTHPLRMVKDQLKIPVVDLINVERYINKTIHVLINVSRIRVIVDKRGQEMAFIEGRDDTGQCDCVCFSSQYSRYRQVLERGETLILEVKVQSKDRITLLINSVEVYDERTSAHRW